MKNSGGVFLLFAIALIFNGCTMFAPQASKDAFPETVGKYKLDSVDHKGGFMESKSWHPATYSPAEGNRDMQIFYALAVHKSPEAARQDQETNIFCSKKEMTENKDKKLEVIKEDKLKDKSGRELGSVTICRGEVKGAYEDLFGNYEYTIVFNHDNQMAVIGDRTNSSATSKRVSLSELISFMRALPDTAQFDFAALNLDAVEGAGSSEVASAKEVAALSPPLKLEKAPYLKGKVLIVQSDKGVVLFTRSPEVFGLSKERVAHSPGDAQTVVQVACEKGESVGNYITKDAAKRKIPVYALRCKISIIDKTIPAVIAQKTIVNKDVSFIAREKTFTEFDQEHVLGIPYTEIKEYLTSLAGR